MCTSYDAEQYQMNSLALSLNPLPLTSPCSVGVVTITTDAVSGSSCKVHSLIPSLTAAPSLALALSFTQLSGAVPSTSNLISSATNIGPSPSIPSSHCAILTSESPTSSSPALPTLVSPSPSTLSPITPSPHPGGQEPGESPVVSKQSSNATPIP